MRDAELEREETRKLFGLESTLRRLARLDDKPRRTAKRITLDEIEAMAMHTEQRSVAVRCHKLLNEFKYMRASSKQKRRA